MSTGNEGIDRQQQKVTEFLRLLPLTLEIAGLPKGELGRYFNEGQMEVRVNTIKTALPSRPPARHRNRQQITLSPAPLPGWS